MTTGIHLPDWCGETATKIKGRWQCPVHGECHEDEIVKATAGNVIADIPPCDGHQWDCQCARCGSSCDYHMCDQCEDGFDGHDCGEDCCCCRYPEDNVVCQICNGNGGWHCCLSSAEWCNANPLPGREGVERGKVEWYRDDEPTH